jgi:hypothetical protein
VVSSGSLVAQTSDAMVAEGKLVAPFLIQLSSSL